MAYVDIAIIVLVALGALIGLFKGFFKTIISFFGWLVSFLIAFFLTKVVSVALLDIEFIKTKVLGETGSLYSAIGGILPAGIESGEGIFGTLLSPLLSLAQASGADVRTGLTLLITNSVYSVIVCLALFILIRIVMYIFTMLANKLTENKTVGAINRIMGFVVGAVKGFGAVCIIMVVMTFFMGMSFMTPVKAQIDTSVIGKPVYEKIYELKNKFISADGNLLDKLLTMAGIDKDAPTPDDPTVAEKATAQANLKATLHAALYNNVENGDVIEDNFVIKFSSGVAKYDTITDSIVTYITASKLKMDKVQTDYTTAELNGFTALLSKGSGTAADGAICAAMNSYLTELLAMKTLNAETPIDDAALTAAKGRADTALTALDTAINGNAKFVALFGASAFAPKA